MPQAAEVREGLLEATARACVGSFDGQLARPRGRPKPGSGGRSGRRRRRGGPARQPGARAVAAWGGIAIRPEQEQRLHQPQGPAGITSPHSPAPRRVEVGVLRHQRVAAMRLAMEDSMVSPRFGQPDKVVEVPSPHCTLRAPGTLGPQPGQRVAADELMHGKPTPRGRLSEDQAALDQDGERADDRSRRPTSAASAVKPPANTPSAASTRCWPAAQQSHRRVQNGRLCPGAGAAR